jgi:hypothetical protein
MLKGSQSNASAVETTAKTYAAGDVMLLLCKAVFGTMLASMSLSVAWVADDAEAAAHKQSAMDLLKVDFHKNAAAAELSAEKTARANPLPMNSASGEEITVSMMTGKVITLYCKLTKDASNTVLAVKHAKTRKVSRLTSSG